MMYAALLQVPFAHQLWLGLLEWLTWEVVRHMWENTLGQPRVTPQEHLQGFLLCYVLPTAVIYASDVYLAGQFARICKQTHKAKLLEDEAGRSCDPSADWKASITSSPTRSRGTAAIPSTEPSQPSPGSAAAPAEASAPPAGTQSAVSVAGSSSLIPLQPSTRAQAGRAPAYGPAARGASSALLRRASLSGACNAAAVTPGSSRSTCPLYVSPLKHMCVALKVSAAALRQQRQRGATNMFLEAHSALKGVTSTAYLTKGLLRPHFVLIACLDMCEQAWLCQGPMLC